MKPLQCHPAGFSLAEVVLAMGISSVALVSLIGALGISLSAEKDSARDTALAAMSSQLVARLSKVPFDELSENAGSATANGDGAVPSSADAGAADRFYFNAQGVLLPASTGSEHAEAAYECVVTKHPCEDTRSPVSGACNLVRLELAYTWPAGGSAPPNLNGHQRLYASVARY
jgi:uncharacterized protein (TIGR02598 family)